MGTQTISAEAWPGEVPRPDAAEADVETAAYYIADDPAVEPAPIVERVLTVFLALAALGWIGAVAWRASLAFTAGRPDLPALLGGVATLSTPLALIGIAYLLLRRTSRREARRFGRTAAAMRAEAAGLERVLNSLSDQIADNRRALGDHAHQLLLLGDDAMARLGEISTAMRGESATLAQNTTVSANAGAGSAAARTAAARTRFMWETPEEIRPLFMALADGQASRAGRVALAMIAIAGIGLNLAIRPGNEVGRRCGLPRSRRRDPGEMSGRLDASARPHHEGKIEP